MEMTKQVVEDKEEGAIKVEKQGMGHLTLTDVFLLILLLILLFTSPNIHDFNLIRGK